MTRLFVLLATLVLLTTPATGAGAAARDCLDEALSFRIAQRMAGQSNVALAARLGCHEGEVRRLLDPCHASGLRS